MGNNRRGNEAQPGKNISSDCRVKKKKVMSLV